MRRQALVPALAAALACEGALPPLRGVGEAGQDPIVIFVGGSEAAGGDLYAVPADGGEVGRLTWSPVGEMRPALAPDGGAVAFLRGGSLSDSAPAAVWLMNLVNGSEREIALPPGAGAPLEVSWSGDGRSLVLETERGLYRSPAPPRDGTAQPIAPGARAAAESLLAVWLGNPPFARAVDCPAPGDLCLTGNDGKPAPLARGSHDPLRWGGDSVAYFTGEALLVRPLGPGRERRIALHGAPPLPRQATVFLGPSARR